MPFPFPSPSLDTQTTTEISASQILFNQLAMNAPSLLTFPWTCPSIQASAPDLLQQQICTNIVTTTHPAPMFSYKPPFSRKPTKAAPQALKCASSPQRGQHHFKVIPVRESEDNHTYQSDWTLATFWAQTSDLTAGLTPQ